MKNSGIIVFFVFVALSCNKKDTNAPAKAATSHDVTVNINNVFGEYPFEFGKQYSTSSSRLVFTKFKYFLSNFMLGGGNTQGWHPISDSYFLIDHSTPASLNLKLKNVEDGEYSSIKFLIGIDSSISASGPYTGALDTTSDMYWNKNYGYIFLNLEGYNNIGKPVSYHIGGCTQPNNSLRWVTIKFEPHHLIVKDGAALVNLTADIKLMFDGALPFDSQWHPLVDTPGDFSKWLADNYSAMFSLVDVK